MVLANLMAYKNIVLFTIFRAYFGVATDSFFPLYHPSGRVVLMKRRLPGFFFVWGLNRGRRDCSLGLLSMSCLKGLIFAKIKTRYFTSALGVIINVFSPKHTPLESGDTSARLFYQERRKEDPKQHECSLKNLIK